MSKTKYTATFSNGFEMKRTSTREFACAYSITTEHGSFGGFSRTRELAGKSSQSDNTRFHGGEGKIEIVDAVKV